MEPRFDCGGTDLLFRCIAEGAIHPPVAEANRNFPQLHGSAAQGFMRSNRSFSTFESGSRRRGTRLPIIPIVLIVLAIGLVALLWSRGGERPQQRVEKAIPAEKLGK